MKIGIIGSGNMGRSLGILWAEQGHEVFFGSRDAEKGKATAEFAGRGTQGGTNDGNLYGATHTYNSVVRIASDRSTTIIAQAESGVIGSTAVAFGQSEGERTAIYVV